jgi:alpha-tubulin suppressor-like RCC1 family protein
MGNNTYGQLGDGTFLVNARTVPQEIESSGVTAIAAGLGHSLFLKAGGLWVMGYNFYGQLGDGIFSFSTTNYLPERIVASGVTAIAAGYWHSLFLKSDGSLWVMGDNPVGQLGDGTYSPGNPLTGVNQPEQIVASNVTAIAAGERHSVFLKSDGSLWAMGDNLVGQLGAGTLTRTNRPMLIVASNVTAIAAGGSHSLFIKNDGSLWVMGALGTDIHLPVQIVGSGVTAIAAGDIHSLIVKCDGSLWGIGRNSQGQLGDTIDPTFDAPELIVAGPPGYNRIRVELLSGGGLRLSLLGIAGASYALESTFSLSPANWVPQATNTTDAAGALSFTNAANSGTQNFWRFRCAP